MNKVAFAISYILLLITAIVAAVLGLKHGATIGLACLTAIAFAWSYGTFSTWFTSNLCTFSSNDFNRR